MTNAELPNLDFSTAALISSAGHPFNILFLKLSTISSLPASLLGILSLAASLCHEVDIGDDHVLAHRLAHVVDGEQSNGGAREGFHLHPCLASALHPENRGLRQKRPKARVKKVSGNEWDRTGCSLQFLSQFFSIAVTLPGP